MELQTLSWLPRVLIIGPGGIKGLKALGFLAILEDSIVLRHVDTYCGVSIGAAITLLIIAGYTIREIIGQAILLDIFNEVESFDFQTISKNKELISTEPSRRQLSNLLINKFGKVPSLYNLYLITGKAFNVVTLNTTDDKCEFLTPFTHPDMSCVDATIFSMNIPFLCYQLIDNKGKIYIDGAFANPYPINHFDDGQTNILGIFMKNKDNDIMIKAKNNTLHKIEDIDNVGIYFIKIIQSLINQKYNDILGNSSNKCRHICLEFNPISLSNRIDVKDKARMLVEGFNEGKIFLQQLRTNSYNKVVLNRQEEYYQYPEYYDDPHNK